ncbi:MAG: PTS sugar transporter subunit IIA [Eubacteriaceae bacterium]|nr:PTS sugar transporter subunit IIA [Eubacteriaceae bacterium]
MAVNEECECSDAGVVSLATDQTMILTNVNADSQVEIIKILCTKALEKGYITEIFIEKILEREKEFPTGLPTAVPVAIPHIHDGCLKSFFSMATLTKPVAFESMDGAEDDINTEMVFLFGITDPSQQCSVLMKFCELFQNEELMKKMRVAENTEEQIGYLKNALGDYLLI